jgi:hypothetical protein
MTEEIKPNDIVELLNFNMDNREGYFMQQIGMLPTVGHKYYVETIYVLDHGGKFTV